MNLSSLSEQLNLSIPELRAKALAKGFKISPRANKIDNQLAKSIFDALSAPKPQETKTIHETKAISLPSYVKVRDFATLLNKPVIEVIKILIKNGVLATINEEIDYETAAIVAQDLGFEVSTEVSEQEEFGLSFLQHTVESEPKEKLQIRPPIVAVMGHVDHGKTTLLDAIRKTRVVEGESGGITQHIGAYQVKFHNKPITFLDTPGHEAFSEMRARGSNVTDLIILVVAADDGVRPQTVEVINRAKFTNTPIIVAINKTDKENANPLRVKQELAEYGVLTEEWGGKTTAVEISAKKNLGIDELLEMILLTAELEELKANPEGKIVGTVIESNTQLGLGSVATVIIQNGTLKLGDIAVAGAGFGKIKSMEAESGKKLKIAPPSTPVRVSGFSTAPEAGDVFQVVDSLEKAKNISSTVLKRQRSHSLRSKNTLTGDLQNKSLNLIIKADVAGSLEAITQSLGKLKNDEVKINILSSGLGEINESDILLAESTKSTIIAFRVKTNPKAINLSKQKKISVTSFDVIYELIETITSAVVAMFTPEYEKISFGKGKIQAIFRTEKGEMIIGGIVTEGEIRKNKKISIIRDSAGLGQGEILELQQNKVSAKEVQKNSEFGMKIKTNVKLQPGDYLESYEENLKQKSL